MKLHNTTINFKYTVSHVFLKSFSKFAQYFSIFIVDLALIFHFSSFEKIFGTKCHYNFSYSNCLLRPFFFKSKRHWVSHLYYETYVIILNHEMFVLYSYFEFLWICRLLLFFRENFCKITAMVYLNFHFYRKKIPFRLIVFILSFFKHFNSASFDLGFFLTLFYVKSCGLCFGEIFKKTSLLPSKSQLI